ncbi:mitochondrial ribosomal protein L47 [Cotesia typhae]|uniref:mitochondrial ribosomal protein L47 n=1 Tax=Cotesia typhae TaxID=2053667 RepID=UPI003D69951F
MATFKNIMRISPTVQNIKKLINTFSFFASPYTKNTLLNISHRSCVKSVTAAFHTTAKRNDLMEFFDDEKNWGQDRVRVGRSWNKDELRLKSNEDLHKLWYILLKEKNMLLTMEHACNQAYEYFPNPERRDKVEESMSNLEEVVRERNIAYHELETGDHGERPSRYVDNQLGLRYRYKFLEHIIPAFMNKSWREKHIFSYGGYAVAKFRRLYREKLFLEKRKEVTRQTNQAQVILKRFPNVDMEALQNAYPKANIKKAMYSKRSRSHSIP